MNTPAPARSAPSGNVKVTKADWIALAVSVLVTDGVESVRIMSLSEKLNVSRSSFYWYFESHQDLLDQLLRHWRETNTRAIIERAQRAAPTITRGVLNVFECWADEAVFSPRLDFAIREWARRCDKVRREIETADRGRLEAIRDLYLRHGYAADDAFIRARVLYYMQIGYYVLDVKEPVATKLGYFRTYIRTFTGVEPTEEDVRIFNDFAWAAHSRNAKTGKSRSRALEQS
jgi:AcrR family transcriptional regulator